MSSVLLHLDQVHTVKDSSHSIERERKMKLSKLFLLFAVLISNHVLGEELEDYFLTECDSSKSSNMFNFSHFIL